MSADDENPAHVPSYRIDHLASSRIFLRPPSFDDRLPTPTRELLDSITKQAELFPPCSKRTTLTELARRVREAAGDTFSTMGVQLNHALQRTQKLMEQYDVVVDFAGRDDCDWKGYHAAVLDHLLTEPGIAYCREAPWTTTATHQLPRSERLQRICPFLTLGCPVSSPTSGPNTDEPPPLPFSALKGLERHPSHPITAIPTESGTVAFPFLIVEASPPSVPLAYVENRAAGSAATASALFHRLLDATAAAAAAAAVECREKMRWRPTFAICLSGARCTLLAVVFDDEVEEYNVLECIDFDLAFPASMLRFQLVVDRLRIYASGGYRRDVQDTVAAVLRDRDAGSDPVTLPAAIDSSGLVCAQERTAAESNTAS